jgi:hypothetical protein
LCAGPRAPLGLPFAAALVNRRLVRLFFDEVPCSACGASNAYDVANDSVTP